MRLEDKRLNLKEGSIPSLFPSKEDIDAGSETWVESQSQSHAATQVPPPLSSANEWLSKSRVKDIEPAMKYWEWFTRSPALVGQSTLGNKEGTGDAFEGAPGSHKKRRDREISNHRARLV